MSDYTITPTGYSEYQVTCNKCGESAIRKQWVNAEASGERHQCQTTPEPVAVESRPYRPGAAVQVLLLECEALEHGMNVILDIKAARVARRLTTLAAAAESGMSQAQARDWLVAYLRSVL